MLNKLDGIITEFIVQTSNPATDEVEVLKISQINLPEGTIKLFGEVNIEKQVAEAIKPYLED